MSHNDEERIVERHLLECLAPAGWLRESGLRRWLDLGSGAGFPAIPLAIVGVGESWTLVESRRTKTLFIRKSIQDIKLEGIEVINDRLENVVMDPGRARAYDGFTARATLRVGPTLELAAKLVRSGGSAFLWKGSGYGEELKLDPAWRKDWDPVETRPVGSGPNIVARFVRK
jgi:16S rRNA (guanine527-N7)-methyltransferase